MVAEFYIIAESFVDNNTSTRAQVEEKIQLLANDFIEIRRYKETNRLFVHPDIYEVRFINNQTISDLLYNDSVSNDHLDRDSRVQLKKIILETEITSYTTEEVKYVLLPESNQDICHGLIGFNAVNDINPEFQVVYDLNGWRHFRRHYLGRYPKNGLFFVTECSKYFPNLFIHPRNNDVVEEILFECSQRLVFHLSALNDIFHYLDIKGLTRTQVLEQFSVQAKLDETASLEGNASRKPALTFDFVNIKEETEKVCCEPHLKLCYSDKYPGDSSYSTTRRVYFHEGKTDIQEGRILIGHIGNHL